VKLHYEKKNFLKFSAKECYLYKIYLHCGSIYYDAHSSMPQAARDKLQPKGRWKLIKEPVTLCQPGVGTEWKYDDYGKIW